MRRSWKYIVLTIILASLVYGGFTAYRVKEAIYNSYAVWWVADMIIESMELNDGQWPTGWQDLRKPYEICTERSGRPWTFDELRDRVEVDWNADPVALTASPVKDGEPTFQVIWLRDGTDSHWESREPNRIIYDYLQGPNDSGRTQPAE